jgi:hypothetical protein
MSIDAYKEHYAPFLVKIGKKLLAKVLKGRTMISHNDQSMGKSISPKIIGRYFLQRKENGE